MRSVSDGSGDDAKIKALVEKYRSAYRDTAQQYTNKTLEALFEDYLDNPPQGIDVDGLAESLIYLKTHLGELELNKTVSLYNLFELANIRLAEENKTKNQRIDDQNEEKKIISDNIQKKKINLDAQVKENLDLEKYINDLYENHVQKSILHAIEKQIEDEKDETKKTALTKKTTKAKVSDKYRLKDKYKRIFNQPIQKNQTEIQTKTKILIKLLLNNYYQFYRDNSAINKNKINRINFKLMNAIAIHGDENLKAIIRESYSAHLKEHKNDSRYLLGMMSSIYQLRDIGIVDDTFLTPENLVGVADSNIWETLRDHAILKMNEYDSSFFRKSDDRVKALEKLRARIKIIDETNDLSAEDKTGMLIQLLQSSSIKAMKTDLEKDEKIGKWSVFSHRNVTGSRYQDMLTDILNKAMPYYISQDSSKRKENLNDSYELELLYKELEILVNRAKLHKVKDNEAIYALYKDPFLNAFRPENTIYRKRDLPLVLDRLRLHQSAIQTYGVTNFSKDAFGVSVDNLIEKIKTYMAVQATNELSQEVKHEKPKGFIPVFSNPLFDLRNRLQTRMHKLSEDNYLNTLLETPLDKDKKTTISTKYGNQLSHMQDKNNDMEKAAVIELMRHIEHTFPDAKDIKYVSSSIDKDHTFVADFEYVNSNDDPLHIQFTIDGFTKEYLKNKSHQVRWPVQSNPHMRIEEEGAPDYKPTIETLFNYCCYAYLKNVAAKITPAVIEELKDICPELEEFRTKFYNWHDKEKYFNPYQQYNVIYSDFMKKIHKDMGKISKKQNDSFADRKNIQTQFDQQKFNEIDNFIISFYENDCKILDTTGKLIIDKLQSANPLLRKNITRIYDAFIKSSGTNALTRFFDKAANEIKAIASDDLQPQYQESYYRRGKSVMGSTYQPMLATSLHSVREYDFHRNKINIPWKEMRIGTQGEFINDQPGVTPFFAAYAEAQARQYPDRKFTHIYFNNLGLDRKSRQGTREKAMTLELHKFGDRHPNVAVITLPADKGLMSPELLKAGTRDTHDVCAEIIKIAQEGSSIDPDKPTSEVRDFYIPPNVKAALYEKSNELDELNKLLNQSIADLGFTDKRTLTGAEAQALYVNFIKFQLTDFIVRKLDPVSINFSCKDAIDRGAFSSLYFNLITSINLGTPMEENEFIRGLHAAAAMVKGRAMNHHLDMFANSLNVYLAANETNPHVPKWLKNMNEERLDNIIEAEKKKNKSAEKTEFDKITLKSSH